MSGVISAQLDQDLSCEQALAQDALWIVSFSGGKDSVATWLHMERELGHRVKCVFADTGHEADATYEYLDTLERDHRMPLVRVYPRVRHLWKRDPPERIPEDTWDDVIDMGRLIELKGRPPSATARFCTTILKLAPLREYAMCLGERAVFMACGVRADESPKRANMGTWGFDEFMGRWRWLPIHSWTAKEVFDLHSKHGVPPNPLYKRGSSRVGCWPCIFARKGELAQFAKDSHGRERLFRIEARTGHTFFARGKVPARYCSAVDRKTGKRINTAEDVIRWALEEQPAFAKDGLFADQEVPLDYGEDIEADSCNSVYGLCE